MIETLLAALVAIIGGMLLGAVLAGPVEAWWSVVRALEDFAAAARAVGRELAVVARRWTA